MSPKPLKPGRIAATLPVTDIDRAVTLFHDIFGLGKMFENGEPTGFVILKMDAAELHLTLQPGHKGVAWNVAHVMVSDAEEAHARCLAHGLRIIKRLQDKEYGLKAFVFADPDGNRIDVGQTI